MQVRGWLYVEGHATLLQILCEASEGKTYNVGGHNEKTNLEVVEEICNCLEKIAPVKPAQINKYHDLIEFVPDRPGHDTRYAIDATKIQNELGWIPKETFETGLFKTVQWYCKNIDWCTKVLTQQKTLK